MQLTNSVTSVRKNAQKEDKLMRTAERAENYKKIISATAISAIPSTFVATIANETLHNGGFKFFDRKFEKLGNALKPIIDKRCPDCIKKLGATKQGALAAMAVSLIGICTFAEMLARKWSYQNGKIDQKYEDKAILRENASAPVNQIL